MDATSFLFGASITLNLVLGFLLSRAIEEMRNG